MIKKLTVVRRFSDGKCIEVGQLAQNKTSVYFQYNDNYLLEYPNLSPFKLPFNSRLQQAPQHPHRGLHGVFSDSLPDGWGLLIMDKLFLQKGVSKSDITSMDRLSFMGNNCMGALSYKPHSDILKSNSKQLVDLNQLGKNAVSLFEGEMDDVLPQLANIGSPGGARPKAQIYLNNKDNKCISTVARPGFIPSLVKFTSANLLLGHEEGLCEAAYLSLANQCGITTPHWQVVSSNKMNWLLMERYDCPKNSEQNGRYHVHSLAGLLDADFRQPSLDYEDIIRASQVLCQSPELGKEFFKRAIFNLFSLNQDDHAKNWEFIQDDNGSWRAAPFFDVTFSPTKHKEHSTSFAGYGKNPPKKAIQKLANLANYKDWQLAQHDIKQILESLNDWSNIAKKLTISSNTTNMIARNLNHTWKLNKGLVE